MISSIFVLSPRGDTILSKMYRTRPEVGAHERSHTEAFFRKIKFWNDMNSAEQSKNSSQSSTEEGNESDGVKRDPPPVFVMPDGQSYLHVNRNGLIFGCATDKNVSPCAVIEVRNEGKDWQMIRVSKSVRVQMHYFYHFSDRRHLHLAFISDRESFQGLLWYTL